jgi:hypothetical protein
MEDEIKVGEYVRLDDGTIGKYQINKNWINVVETNDKYIGFDIEKDIVEHSKNIIDLIEEGDYVNRCLVTAIYDEYKNDNTIQFETNYEGRYRYYSDGDIKSIVTKEQFASMEYKIKELNWNE